MVYDKLVEVGISGEFVNRRPAGETRQVPEPEIVRTHQIEEHVGVAKRDRQSVENVLERLAQETRQRRLKEEGIRGDFRDRIREAKGSDARQLRLERDKVLYDSLEEFRTEDLPDGCVFANEEVARAAFEEVGARVLQDVGTLSIARYLKEGDRENLAAAVERDGALEVARKILDTSFPFIRPGAYDDVLVRILELMGMDERLKNIRFFSVGQYSPDNGTIRATYFPGNLKKAFSFDRENFHKFENPYPVAVVLAPSDLAREYALGNVNIRHEGTRPLWELVIAGSMPERGEEFRKIQEVRKLPLGEDGMVDPNFIEREEHTSWTKSLQAG